MQTTFFTYFFFSFCFAIAHLRRLSIEKFAATETSNQDPRYSMNFQLKTLWSVYCQQLMFNEWCMRTPLSVVLVFVCFVGIFFIIFITIVAVVVVVFATSVAWNDTYHSLSHHYRCCMRSSAEHVIIAR